MSEAELAALKKELKNLDWSEEAVDLGVTQRFRCFYCDRPLLASIEDYDAWQIDQIVPTTKQGLDEAGNKVVACKLCNFAKRNFDPRKAAAPNASVDELKRIAVEYVQEMRQRKANKLHEIRKVLEKSGLM